MFIFKCLLAISCDIVKEIEAGYVYRAYNNIICTDMKEVLADPSEQKRLVNLQISHTL